MEVLILCLVIAGLVLFLYKKDDDKKWEERKAIKNLKFSEELRRNPYLNINYDKADKVTESLISEYPNLRRRIENPPNVHLIRINGNYGEFFYSNTFVISEEKIKAKFAVIDKNNYYQTDVNQTFTSSSSEEEMYNYISSNLKSSLTKFS